MLKAREQICHHHHQYCHYHNFPLNFLPRLPTCLPNTWAGLANELQSTDQLPEATETLFCFSISAFTFCILNFVCYMKLHNNLLIARLQLFTRNAIYICYLLCYKLVTANVMSDLASYNSLHEAALHLFQIRLCCVVVTKMLSCSEKSLIAEVVGQTDYLFFSHLLLLLSFWLWTTTSPPFQLCTTTPSLQV